MLKVDLKDLVFKNYSDLQVIREADLDSRNYSSDTSQKQSLNYIIIFCEKRIGNRAIKFLSPKIYLDLDTIKIKIYLNGGFLNIEHSSDYSSYRYDLNFLYQL